MSDVEMTYSLQQLSDMTGVPRSTLDKARRTGSLEAFRLPGMERGWRVPKSEAERFFGGGAIGGR